MAKADILESPDKTKAPSSKGLNKTARKKGVKQPRKRGVKG